MNHTYLPLQRTLALVSWLAAVNMCFAGSAGAQEKSALPDPAVEEKLVTGVVPIVPAPPALEPSSDSGSPLELEYRISPGDVLSFESLDEESINRTVTVRFDGYVSLPWISDTYVEGLTRDEAVVLITDAYRTIFQDPTVFLTIQEVHSRTYTVAGDVTKPDIYEYSRPISVFGAIMTAGGPRINQRGGDTFVSAQGELVKAFVIRGAGESRTVNELDLRGIQNPGPHSSAFPVYPGDLIYVPEGVNLVYLLGEVGDADVYEMTEGLTLLRLLATAGSFSASTARIQHVVLIRQIGDDQTELTQINVRTLLKHGGDVRLEPGDVVYVPRKRILALTEFIGRLNSIWTDTIELYTDAYEAFRLDEEFQIRRLTLEETKRRNDLLETP